MQTTFYIIFAFYGTLKWENPSLSNARGRIKAGVVTEQLIRHHWASTTHLSTVSCQWIDDFSVSINKPTVQREFIVWVSQSESLLWQRKSSENTYQNTDVLCYGHTLPIQNTVIIIVIVNTFFPWWCYALHDWLVSCPLPQCSSYFGLFQLWVMQNQIWVSSVDMCWTVLIKREGVGH